MQSDGQTNVLEQPQALPWDDTHHNDNDAGRQARHLFLAQEHRDLDDMIALVAATADEALLTRLKKRKLHIKDEMARLEAVAS